MGDEKFYLIATNEFTNNHRNDALWAKSLAVTQGDKKQAKYKYIDLRVDQLKRTDEADIKKILANYENTEKCEIRTSIDDLGFVWWQLWAWSGFLIVSLTSFRFVNYLPEVVIPVLILNVLLMFMVIQYNKYAFLIATLLSFNPIIWIVNGFYLKNRWNHPRVNGIRDVVMVNEIKDSNSEEENSQLFDASRSGDYQTVKRLLELGVSPNISDSQGYSPSDYARGRGHMRVARLLDSVQD